MLGILRRISRTFADKIGQNTDATYQELAKTIKLLRDDTEKQNKKIDELSKAVQSLRGMASHEKKWRVPINRKIDALIRHSYLEKFLSKEMPLWLVAQRFQISSQNEEDGMVLALLELAGIKHQTFVDIGCGATGGNSLILSEEFGWRGLMVDASESAIEKCKQRVRHNKSVSAIQTYVTPNNVNDILKDAGFSGEIDILSLDIDSYDYWVFSALDVVQPRVLVLEYNAHLGPEKALTVPLEQTLEGAPKFFSGASLTALTKAAEQKGYRLLACDNMGVNAFYLRDDLRPEIEAVPVGIAFREQRDRTDPRGEALRVPKQWPEQEGFEFQIV